MARSIVITLASVILLVAASMPADAARRVALVVGNDLYSNLPADKQLRNAVADARAMRDTLQALGFEVLYGENLGRSEMVDRMFDLTARVGPEDTAFVFFAGHGVAFSGANYLLPSDIPAPRATGRAEEGRLAEQSIAEATVIERLTGAGVRVAIVVLDACRNNPLQGTDRRTLGASRGFVQSQPARGVFSIYSAGFGQEALDRLGPGDPHPNSVFTRVFMDKLRTPGLDLKAIATETRRTVASLAESVGHDQFPAYYDQILHGDVYLAGAPAAAPAAPAPATAVAAPPSAIDPCAAAEAHWRSTESLGTASAFEEHLQVFGGCVFAGLARARLAALAAPPPPPASTLSPDNSWFVILGAWPRAAEAEADRRLAQLRARGVEARKIDTDAYPNLADGLSAVVIGPYSRTEALQRLPGVKALVGDAYVKAGF